MVEGSVRGRDSLNLLIDTGAEYSIVDSRVAHRLGLTLIPQEVRLEAFGQMTTVGRAIIPGFNLGPTSISFPCLLADIPFRGVDAIVGLDVLRRCDLTIDYRTRKLVFGKSQPMEDRIPFEREARLLIVQLRVGDRTLRMSVDTALDGICLYDEGWQSRATRLVGAPQSSVIHLGGETLGRQVSLAHVFLGSRQWKWLRAAVLRPVQPLEREGTLGVAALGLARIHFDFEKYLISWNR